MGDFAASFKGFMDTMMAQAPVQEAGLTRRLKQHFGVCEFSSLAIVSRAFQTIDHPDLYGGLQRTLEGREVQLVGIAAAEHFGAAVSLAQIVGPQAAMLNIEEGPVEYTQVSLQNDECLSCVKRGLFLVQGDPPLAVLLNRNDAPWGGGVGLEVMAPDQNAAEALLGDIRKSMRQESIYRGRVISLSTDGQQLSAEFHYLPPVARDDIILPQGLLRQIERHALGFSRHREALRAGGRHMKRGLLLFGPPGTGKTLTAMYLAGLSPERTVLLMVGRTVGLLQQTCAMARMLQPSTVILEDVDLIAEERTSKQACTTLLFELLNEMDGLGDDADVLFLLTTNRPELLEPALAARPGRVDQALEVPLPDAECRRRLLELYFQGLRVDCPDSEPLVSRTEGVSAAFIRELVRRAALLAAEQQSELVVRQSHLEEALRELAMSQLTRQLLGAGELSPD